MCGVGSPLAHWSHRPGPHPDWPRGRFAHTAVTGHTEDILCAAFCPPGLLCTGSSSGEIIAWNLQVWRVRHAC